MATGQLVGGLCGPVLGGLLADRMHGYREVFFFTSAFALAGSLLCTLAVREDFSPRERRTGEARPPIWAQFRELARHPSLAPMFVVVLLAQVSALGVQPIISLMGSDERSGKT